MITTPINLLDRANHLDRESALYGATGMRRAARDARDEANLLRQLAREAAEFQRRYPHLKAA